MPLGCPARDAVRSCALASSRVCFLILYCFYKNITNTLTLFFYCFTNGFTGAR